MSFPPLAGHLPFYGVVAIVFLVMISVLVFAHEAGHYLFARLFNMGVEEFAIGFGKRPWVYGRRKYVLQLRPGEDPALTHGGGTLGMAAIDQYVSAPSEGLQRVAKYVGSLEGSKKPLAPTDDNPDSPLVKTPRGLELHEETVFTVRPIPAGGFVRIKGMMPEEDGSETRIPGGFYSKPPWQRLIVLLAGPAFSVLAGILILVPVFMIDGITTSDTLPHIGEVLKGKPAYKAGLHEGDLVLSIQNQKVTTFSDVLQKITRHPGVPLAFVCERGGKQFTVTITPEIDMNPTPVVDSNFKLTGAKARQGRIGVVPPTVTTYPSLTAALAEAAETPVEAVANIAQIFQSRSGFSDNVSGPVAMVEFTTMAVQDGIVRILRLMALLSISVGIFNLLPFPPLDGGQMVIAFAEMLRGGRRLSMQIQGLVSGLGMLAVLSLVVCAVYVDVQQIGKPLPKVSGAQTVPVAQPATAKPSAPKPTAK